MINSMQFSIIKKDLQSITSNKRLFPVLLIIPLIFTIIMPSMFIFIIYFVPEGSKDFQNMLELLPFRIQSGDIRYILITFIMNKIIPIFFMMIPIMAASVMAASSFVGEKEKRTLETLLYSPLTLKQIFQSKILASFLLSMIVSFTSFIVMMIVVQIEFILTMGLMLVPDIGWLVTMLLISPAISLMAITLIVGGSAKAQTMEESQQRAVFLILPIVLLLIGQFTGIILINVWILLGMGIVFAVLALLFMKISIGKFNYETLLR